MRVRFLYLLFRVYTFLFRPIRIGTRIMMIQDEQVLLIRHTYIPGWFMPGGGVKRGETLEQTARREAREETGAEIHELRLLGVYTSFGDYKTDHNIVFLSRGFTLHDRHDDEIAEVRFFPLNKLPADLMPGHRQRLEEYRAGGGPPQFGEW